MWICESVITSTPPAPYNVRRVNTVDAFSGPAENVKRQQLDLANHPRLNSGLLVRRIVVPHVRNALYC